MIDFLIFCFVMYIIFFGGFYFLHYKMTASHSKFNFNFNKKVKFITFKKFYSLFRKQIWEQNGLYFSYFGRWKNSKYVYVDDMVYRKNYIHAGIIAIEGTGYVFYPHSYQLFILWQIKQLFKKTEPDVAIQLLDL